MEGAVAAWIGDRECPALHLVRKEFLVARPLRDVGYAARDSKQVQALGVLENGNDQPLAVGQLDRETEVDVVPRHNLLAANLAVDPRILTQRLDGRARDEGEVGRVDTVRGFVLLLQPLADRYDLRHVHLDRARNVGRSIERAAHVLGDAPAHGGHRL